LKLFDIPQIKPAKPNKNGLTLIKSGRKNYPI